MDPSSPERAIIDILLESSSADLRASISTSQVLSNIVAGHEKHLSQKKSDDLNQVVNLEYIMNIETLLLRGQRDEALASAIEAQDWSMAMMLACVCGPEKYQEVVKSYAHTMFPQSSALHLLSMVYSNQGPKVIAYNATTVANTAKFISPTIGNSMKSEGQTISGLMTNWRSNLAGLLSNKTGEWEHLVKLFGSRLASEKHVSTFSKYLVLLVILIDFNDF